MKNWNDYKKTFSSPGIFDYARSGDLSGFAELLTTTPHLDLNQRNHKGYSPLMLAVYNGQDVFAEALLRGGADPNSADLVGNTVLMGASFKGNILIIQMLLSYGANPKTENDAGMTAYDWAQTFGRQEVMQFFKQDTDFPKKSLIENYFRFLFLGFKLVLKRKKR